MNADHAPDTPDHAWEASVSAWVDGEAELRAEELDTPYGRQVWDTYHLIGDVLRSQDLAIQPTERFYARVSAALDAEPVLVAPAPVGRRHLVRVGLSGLAVAAAVASVVWVARPFVFGAPGAPGAAPEPPMLVQADPQQPDPGLDDYMLAHQAVAGSGPVRQASYDRMGSR